jgi:ribonuclease HI
MIKSYCDGASRGNPGPSAYSYVIYDGDKIIDEHSCYQGVTTNNTVEHIGLNRLLRRLNELLIMGADIFCDSILVVNQVSGTWRVKHENLLSIAAESTWLKLQGGHVLHHIKGHSGIPGNERADQLCNECLNGVTGKKKS